MEDKFLTNKNEEFLNKLKENFNRCNSFSLSVSFITQSGIGLIEEDIIAALKRGAKGRIITSTYKNFTDIVSLNKLLALQEEFDRFECHLDFQNFPDKGFHSKGYIFEYDDSFELIAGSSNLTRYALINNIEWNISLVSKEDFESHKEALKEFDYLWGKTLKLDEKIISEYEKQYSYSVERWNMDISDNLNEQSGPNRMQKEALKEIDRFRGLGIKKTLIISATATGKTYLAAFDAYNYSPKKLLYIVHRESILKDARVTFENIFGAEKTYGFFTGNEKDLERDFIFATSSMLSRHLGLFSKTEFDYIVYDEVHHIVADTGKRIFDYFEPKFMLGLTATPERMDNKDVFALFDGNVPYELRLREAILNNLVVPFHYYGIRDKLVDYSPRDRYVIAKSIADSDNINFIKEQIEKHRDPNKKLKCIAFCTNKKSCSLMAERLREVGYETISLTGDNDIGLRMKSFSDIQDDNNPLEIICTVDILNEGIDIPQLNMVLFLRPTESQTIFIQQLGRGLRKYINKKFVTVLDFIGNNYDRAVQIALALGSLGKTTYVEKAYLKQMIKSNFKSLDIPDLVIDIDDLSKEEIIDHIDNTNFNSRKFLEKDYYIFKDYINSGSYPTHMDYYNSEVAPDLIRMIKSRLGNGKNKSYYNFLKKIDEETIPIFNEEEINLINSIEDLLPISRLDEYLIINQAINEKKIDLKSLEGKEDIHVTDKSLENALENLKKLKIIDNEMIDICNIENEELEKWIKDTINYGFARYRTEYGEYEGLFKKYANYYTEQYSRMLLMHTQRYQKGTYIKDGITYIFACIKKGKDGRLNYKDKFIDNKTFQWESIADIPKKTKDQIRKSKKVHLFIRKIEEEDNITLPYTYFGSGSFTNERNSFTMENGKKHQTLLFDIILDDAIEEDYLLNDFEIPINNK